MGEIFIMIVDDETPFVETMAKRLEKRGLFVLTAFSGQEALEKLAENKNLDLVLLDVKMPGMDGIETLREIKKMIPLAEVVMLTGHATVENAIKGMKLGAFDYLMKPCDIDLLMKKVQEGVDKKRNHEEKIKEANIKAVLSTRHLPRY
ncbi:MAG: response regulator [Deltaproteobacteria bacterium]|nr:response regulator [Deltaproteobacteria bacterium]